MYKSAEKSQRILVNYQLQIHYRLQDIFLSLL